VAQDGQAPSAAPGPNPNNAEKENPELLSVTEIEERQPSTLTARTMDTWNTEGTIAIQSNDAPDIGSREAAPSQPEAAIAQLFNRLDSESGPRAKHEALCELQAIGGCSVSRGLVDRLLHCEPYLQCRILRVLDELAERPYRQADSCDSDKPSQQLLTIDTVWTALSDLENKAVSTCIREAVNGAKESVMLHKSQYLHSFNSM